MGFGERSTPTYLDPPLKRSLLPTAPTGANVIVLAELQSFTHGKRLPAIMRSRFVRPDSVQPVYEGVVLTRPAMETFGSDMLL